MKTKINSILFLITFSILFSSGIFAQEKTIECKVLIAEISGSYEGKCKDGLANGKGVARGIDKYEGKFKNGLPNGRGKYMWANGDYYDGYWKEGKKSGEGIFFTASENKKIKGIWKDDEFYKEIEELPYQIMQMQNVSSVSIQEKAGGMPNTVELIFNRNGQEMRYVNTLMLSSSTGSTKESQAFSGFENIFFPFEGLVEYEAMNKFNTVRMRCKVKFKITKAGSWKVVIKY